MIVTPDFSGTKVLIAGGSGFIGRALALKLSSADANVTTVGNQKSLNAEAGITHHQLDLTDRVLVKKVLGLGKFDFVFNLAGYVNHAPYFSGGRTVMDAHYIGALNLLEQTHHAGLRRFVQIGTSDEYGNARAPQSEDMREAPISPYSAAKAGVTHLIEALARSEGFPGTVARLFLVYGPGQDAQRFFPQVIRSCLRGEEFAVSSGEQLRDFCYIDDIVGGLMECAVSRKAMGQVINLASGAPVSIKDAVQLVVRQAGGGVPLFGRHPYRPGENMALFADTKKRRRLLKWAPTVDFEDGVDRTIQWYRRRMKS